MSYDVRKTLPDEGYDVWKTLYNDDFYTQKYLYHYTTFEKALKIIYSEELRFSPITNTNDTTESKPKIIYNLDDVNDEVKRKLNIVTSFFNKRLDTVRLLCFSCDTCFKNKEKKQRLDLAKNNKFFYYDISGRGFALPRMWAQYSSNSTGVCFIIDKKRFENELNDNLSFYKSRKVNYNYITNNYVIDSTKFESLSKKITTNSLGSITLLNSMLSDDDFIRYSFFEKSSDWSNEQEYRYITITDNPTNVVAIKNLFNYLAGIVVGEKMAPAYVNAIKKILPTEIQIKQLVCEGGEQKTIEV